MQNTHCSEGDSHIFADPKIATKSWWWKWEERIGELDKHKQATGNDSEERLAHSQCSEVAPVVIGRGCQKGLAKERDTKLGKKEILANVRPPVNCLLRPVRQSVS